MSELASKKAKSIIIISGQTINTISQNITTSATHTTQQDNERRIEQRHTVYNNRNQENAPVFQTKQAINTKWTFRMIFLF
jgi:hypothetical protein